MIRVLPDAMFFEYVDATLDEVRHTLTQGQVFHQLKSAALHGARQEHTYPSVEVVNSGCFTLLRALPGQHETLGVCTVSLHGHDQLVGPGRSREGRTPVSDNGFIGYLGAVVAAAISLVVTEIAWGAIGEGAADLLRPDRLAMELSAVLFVLLTYALVAGLTALLPFLGVRKIAERFGVRTGWFYAVAGGVTGLILTSAGSVLLSALPTFPASPEPDPTFWQGITTLAPFFALSGTIGGLTYWWISVKRH
jgi:hypothetical protein